jgi:nicotinamidase-related amidase
MPHRHDAGKAEVHRITSPAKYIVRIDVDTQIGFCLPHGHLTVAAPPATLANIKALVRDVENRGLCLVGCVDSHAYDDCKFQNTDAPFPAHCVKGTEDCVDWLKTPGTRPKRFRFVPTNNGNLDVDESPQGSGNGTYDAKRFSADVRGGAGVYFKKAVDSAYPNPNCKAMLAQPVEDLGGRSNVTFQVFGYCTGGYCVDGFAEGLCADGYNVEVILDATVAIGGKDGMEKSRVALAKAGCKIITTREALSARAELAACTLR